MKRNFFELTRAYSIQMSIMPWFVAVCFASFTMPQMLDVLLTLIVVVCLHLGANLLDDYIDVKMEAKKFGGDLSKISFNIGKNKAELILKGAYSMFEVAFIIFILFAIPAIIGVYYTILYGPVIPLLALATLALCALYPISTKYGLGEVIVGFLFGPMLTFGTYFVLTGPYPFEIGYYTLGYFSISLAFLTMVLLHTHALMDFDYDIQRGRKTLCTVFKTKANALYTLGVLILLAYLNIVYLIGFGVLSRSFLLVFLTIPIALKLVKSMGDYINVRDVALEPKWWMGPMEGWQEICARNNQYFMFRFYLARNLMFGFALIASIVCLMVFLGGIAFAYGY